MENLAKSISIILSCGDHSDATVRDVPSDWFENIYGSLKNLHSINRVSLPIVFLYQSMFEWKEYSEDFEQSLPVNPIQATHKKLANCYNGDGRGFPSGVI